MIYPMYFDRTYILVLIGVLICMAASAKMRSTFQRYSRVMSHSGMTGRETAERLLRGAGIYDVRVEYVSGNLGLLFNSNSSALFLNLGVLAFSASVLFQVVTLPVEFNASGRALRILGDTGMLYPDEVRQTRKVLTAAALTYVAGAAAAILQLLRILLLTGSRRND